MLIQVSLSKAQLNPYILSDSLRNLQGSHKAFRMLLSHLHLWQWFILTLEPPGIHELKFPSAPASIPRVRTPALMATLNGLGCILCLLQRGPQRGKLLWVMGGPIQRTNSELVLQLSSLVNVKFFSERSSAGNSPSGSRTIGFRGHKVSM